MPRRSFPLLLAASVLASCVDDAPVASPADRSASEPVPIVEPDFLGTPDPALLTIKAPVRLASTPGGNVLLADYQQGAILRLDPSTLQPDQAFRVDGKPSAVALMGDRIFVANATTGTVDVFGSDGRWRYSFAPGIVEQPTDVAVDAVRQILFVVSGRLNAVKAFDPDGDLQFEIRDLWKPTGIALDASREEILISDYGEPGHGEPAAVKVFDYDGTLVASILGSGGSGDGRFSRPQGLVVDDHGRIYLVDALSSEILTLDRETGATISVNGTFGSEPGQLLLPLDIVVERTGDVLVTSYRTGSIERFSGVAAR